jgi:hypothetical protein
MVCTVLKVGIQPRTFRSRLALYNHTDLYALLIDTLFNQFQRQLQHTGLMILDTNSIPEDGFRHLCICPDSLNDFYSLLDCSFKPVLAVKVNQTKARINTINSLR